MRAYSGRGARGATVGLTQPRRVPLSPLPSRPSSPSPAPPRPHSFHARISQHSAAQHSAASRHCQPQPAQRQRSPVHPVLPCCPVRFVFRCCTGPSTAQPASASPCAGGLGRWSGPSCSALPQQPTPHQRSSLPSRTPVRGSRRALPTCYTEGHSSDHRAVQSSRVAAASPRGQVSTARMASQAGFWLWHALASGTLRLTAWRRWIHSAPHATDSSYTLPARSTVPFAPAAPPALLYSPRPHRRHSADHAAAVAAVYPGTTPG
jgi:hypothetical protein